jgi:ferric-chelate reductase (NADPH)
MGPTGSILYARADTRGRLQDVLESVAHQLEEHLPGLQPAWSPLDKPGVHLPNFSLARVAGVTRIASDFLRLEGGDLVRFARDLIHFRLILHPQGAQAPAWPVIGDDGRTVWPKGAAALHRPAYTVRHIDPGAGWLETDIFVHEGGRACGFAAHAVPGTVVGLTGPGGGGVVQGDSLLIGGDETAYPALARTIEAAGPDTTGECHLFGAWADYPLPGHPGIRVIHAPGGEADLAHRLKREGTDAQGIWLATERSRLEPLRAAINDHGASGHRVPISQPIGPHDTRIGCASIVDNFTWLFDTHPKVAGW